MGKDAALDRGSASARAADLIGLAAELAAWRAMPAGWGASMLVLSFALYLMTLIVAPTVVGHRAGLALAMRVTLMELGLVFAAWLVIWSVSLVVLAAWPAGSEIWRHEPGIVAAVFGLPSALLAITKLVLFVPWIAAMAGAMIAVLWGVANAGAKGLQRD